MEFPSGMGDWGWGVEEYKRMTVDGAGLIGLREGGSVAMKNDDWVRDCWAAAREGRLRRAKRRAVVARIGAGAGNMVNDFDRLFGVWERFFGSTHQPMRDCERGFGS
mmetsp:Transcript_26869/g.54324  ORF Transcript_26869/g.54324 Transcript_26869/m.54324 type:complete len:107 (+) Transcript_26869:841-1161(+)